MILKADYVSQVQGQVKNMCMHSIPSQVFPNITVFFHSEVFYWVEAAAFCLSESTAQEACMKQEVK